MILSEFTNGGGVATIKVYRWLGTGTGDSRLQLVPAIEAGALAMVSANSSGYPVPVYSDGTSTWKYCNKENKDCGTYYPGSFFEGKVKISGLLTSAQLCKATFLLETRQSFSLSAMLGDFIAGSFDYTPDPPTLAGDGACMDDDGESLTLSVVRPQNGVTCTWYSNKALTQFVQTGISLTKVFTSGTTYYWVTAKIEHCESSASMDSATIYPNPTCNWTNIQHATNGAKNNGSLTVEFGGGTGPYEVSLNGSAFVAQTSPVTYPGLSPGDYAFIVKDANGCTHPCSQTLEWAPSAFCSAVGSTEDCYNDLGSIEVTFGETELFNILLENNANPGVLTLIVSGLLLTESPYTIENVAGGVYTVHLVDGGAAESTCPAIVTIPVEIELSFQCPGNLEVAACQTQDAVNAAFETWLEGFSVSGGTPPLVITVNGSQVENLEVATLLGIVSAPDADACDGSSVTVTVVVSDACDHGGSCSPTFSVAAPADITYVDGAPQDDGALTCEIETQDAVDAAIAAWVTAQTAALEASLEGGCDPQVSNDWVEESIVLCEGGSVTVEWTVTDLCETIDGLTATFTLTAPAEDVWATCNPGPILACKSETEIDAAFQIWKDGFDFGGGCDPQTNIDELALLDWRGFGNMVDSYLVSFTLNVTDIPDCSSASVTCTFTILPCAPNCETAYGKGDDAICFIGDTPISFSRWGWRNLIEPGESYKLELWAGAADCDPSKGEFVGTVEVTHTGSAVTVHYIMDPDLDFYMSEAHVYVGCDAYPTKNGTPTVAPGQYTHNAGGLDMVTDYTVEFTGVCGSVWVIAHAVTCEIEGYSPALNPDSGLPYTGSIECDDCVKSAHITTGVFDYGISNFKVYPNPFSDKVKFEFVSNKNASAVLEIHNIVGQKIVTLMDQKVEQGVINRIEYEPVQAVSGIYIYKLTIDGAWIIETGTNNFYPYSNITFWQMKCFGYFCISN